MRHLNSVKNLILHQVLTTFGQTHCFLAKYQLYVVCISYSKEAKQGPQPGPEDMTEGHDSRQEYQMPPKHFANQLFSKRRLT